MNLTSQKMIYPRESAKLSKTYRATKTLFLRNLIKVNTTVLISRQDKLNEGQVLLDDLNTLFFFYKNIFYKNIEAEICEILRIL